jgi:hypothetical protein
MQPRRTCWIFALLLACVGSARADDLYLTCHPGVSIAAADFRDVFLGEKQFIDSTRLIPVDNVAEQGLFLEKVLKMTAVKYATTWAKKSFRDGVNPPAAMANDAAVLDFIRRTPGVCGYVGIEPSQGVVMIAKF